jgi:hypothetical protein
MPWGLPHRSKTETPSFPSNYVLNIPTENTVMFLLFSLLPPLFLFVFGMFSLGMDGYMYRVQSSFREVNSKDLYMASTELPFFFLLLHKFTAMLLQLPTIHYTNTTNT